MSGIRKILLGIAVALLLALSSWIIWNAVDTSRTKFLTGLPPEEIRNRVFARKVDLAQMHPPALRPTDPVRYGGVTSSASVIEYGDFECEACRDMHQAIESVLPQYEGKVRFVWRDLPIQESNPNALDAAIFARCAGVQGKFWEAHDALYAASALDERTFDAIARNLELNRSALSACRAEPAVQKAIQDDVDQSRSDGITTAPLLFIGTRAIQGPISAEELDREIKLFLGS